MPTREESGAAAAAAPTKPAFPFHSRSCAECLAHFGVDAERGLSAAAVEEQRRAHGANELEQRQRETMMDLFLEQFDDFLVKILIASAALSFVLALVGDYQSEGVTAFIEPLVIVAILVLNAAMGVYQEMNAQSAVDKLKQLQSEHARCIRDGALRPDLPSADLVPGDVIELLAGDRVPADCRVLRLKSTILRTNESSLTGESQEAEKQTAVVPESSGLSGKLSMVFSGTTVSCGAARCLVVETGMRTEMGAIQHGLMASDEEEKKTPLSEKLDAFGEVLAKIIGVICILVWVVNIGNFGDPIHGGLLRGAIYYLKIAVSLGVAAIPEGLPAVITLCLSLGSSRMAKKNCIVRKLPSVETLGCTTVICSDKTGTLTTNRMVASKLVHFGATEGLLQERSVSGSDYHPEGVVEDLATAGRPLVERLSQICSLCTETTVHWDAASQGFACSGSPTEAALKILSEKLAGVLSVAREGPHDCSAVSRHWEAKFELVQTLEFTSDRKRMSMLVRGPGGSRLLGKGASEMVLSACTRAQLSDGRVVPLEAARRRELEGRITALASQSLRTLVLFESDDVSELERALAGSITLRPEDFSKYETNLIFCGLVGIRDPPRPEVHASITRCREAGIRVMMITGDNASTACAIAREIGIFESEAEAEAHSFDGKTFVSLPTSRQLELLGGHGGRVFSRAEPAHKQTLVRLLRDLHEVVAMTGDGVNDAPALANADIGVAMGLTGTEVAKEAAAMILADDDFSTIVSAVEEGRAIYQNTKAFIRYLISSNIGEVVSVFLTAIVGLPEALIPVQLLWVNLVTDGPPATALGFNPPDPDSMMHPPRGRDESLITPWIMVRYLVIGTYVGLATVGIFVYWYLFDRWGSSIDGHTLVSWSQLRNWSECPSWSGFHVSNYKHYQFSSPCEYFVQGKETPSTLSLTVLVTIEMFNALNAISENNSLLTIPLWSNPNLLLAVGGSFLLHFCILYIPVLNVIFEVDPLSLREWLLVVLFSLPVIVIEEILKWIARTFNLN